MRTTPPFSWIMAEGFLLEGNQHAADLTALLRSKGLPYTLIMHVLGRSPWNQPGGCRGR